MWNKDIWPRECVKLTGKKKFPGGGGGGAAGSVWRLLAFCHVDVCYIEHRGRIVTNITLLL